MIPTSLLTAILFNLILSIALPMGIMLWLRRRGGRWPAFFAGAAAFVLFAMVLEQALHYLEEASAIAEEMKALFPQYFATYPIVVKLAKGDLLSKLSQPGAQELLKEGLEYKAGSQPNDALLLYTLKEYHSNGLYTK